MKKWKTISSEYVYKSPFGNLRKDKCELPDGQMIDSYYVNEYSNWVNAIVITKDNNLVLVEQFRYAGDDTFLEVPAGKAEEGESQEQGMLRELREETGYTSQTAPVLLGEFMVNPATQTNKVKTYLITDAVRQYDQDLDDTEDITVRLVDFDDMEHLIRTKAVTTQLFTVTAYYMAKAFLSGY